MARRKPFLLRLDPAVHAALERWAAQELRSLNGQIEYLLRQALTTTSRMRAGAVEAAAETDGEEKR